MSGKDSNEEHPWNIEEIFFVFDISHFEISRNNFNDEHSKDNPSKISILLVFHFEISGKDSNEEHLLNIKKIFLTFDRFPYRNIWQRF